jgi:hypothetical protein
MTPAGIYHTPTTGVIRWPSLVASDPLVVALLLDHKRLTARVDQLEAIADGD